MLATKVTPAAFTACRSQGASSHGRLASRVSGGVLDSRSSSVPRRGRSLAAVTVRAGCSNSSSADIVGATPDRSHAAPSRTTHTDGPPTAGSCTRPTSTAAPASSGRLRPPINRSRMRSSAFLSLVRRAYPTRWPDLHRSRVGSPACGIIVGDGQTAHAPRPARRLKPHGPRAPDPRRRCASRGAGRLRRHPRHPQERLRQRLLALPRPRSGHAAAHLGRRRRR